MRIASPLLQRRWLYIKFPEITGAYPARLIARSVDMSRASTCHLKKTNVPAMHCDTKLRMSYLHTKLPAEEMTLSS